MRVFITRYVHRDRVVLGRRGRNTHHREILQERNHGELLLSGSHEVGGDLLGEGRGHGARHGGLDAARGKRPGHGALVEAEGKRHLF